MKKIYLTAVASLVALSLTGGLLAAQETHDGISRHDKRGSQMHGPGPDYGGPGAMGRMAEYLGLDDAQQETVKNIMAAARPEFEALRLRSQENREALRSLDVNDADYGVNLQNLAAQSGELATETALLQGKVRAEIHTVLTPDQQQKMAEGADRLRQRDREHPRRGAK